MALLLLSFIPISISDPSPVQHRWFSGRMLCHQAAPDSRNSVFLSRDEGTRALSGRGSYCEVAEKERQLLGGKSKLYT
ncbi:hypothetical protein NPIL_638381 [Nephila pilipes]|uniref:Uncharacterized protein n=1 Tax=Nephila pilipes TaxID=299642 RepID=A0A8X6MXT7_NEPPI|nr:hypothetical protein NPIL_638381 [Nephila pilipes]